MRSQRVLNSRRRGQRAQRRHTAGGRRRDRDGAQQERWQHADGPQLSQWKVQVRKRRRRVASALAQPAHVFRLGLVWDIDDYELKPELEGYNFAPTGAKNVFKSTKLSKLKISYADAATKRPLPEVLMSLSGGGENSNYRSNSVVNADGQIVVVGLVRKRQDDRGKQTIFF